MYRKTNTGWAVWLTGLPGSGKTTIAKELKKICIRNKIQVTHLRLDELRRIITPRPKYTQSERDIVYRALVTIAYYLTQYNVNLIIDATAHRMTWRNLAKKYIKKFAEVYIKCPLKTCITRESMRKNNLVIRNIYRKALGRLKTGRKASGVGEVIGIDVPYERPKKPTLTIESNKLSAKEAASMIFKCLKEMNFF